MKTGAELVDFKNFNSQNKQSIGDFEKLRSRQISDVVDTSAELFSDEIDNGDEGGIIDEIEEEEQIEGDMTKGDEIQPDELVVNGGTNIQRFHSHPYGIGKKGNTYNKGNVDKVKNFTDFTGIGSI